jgi:hypothetical protein
MPPASLNTVPISEKRLFTPVFWIRIRIRICRIRMFLGLSDPYPDRLVTSRIRILPFSHISVERTEIMVAK